MRGLLPEPVDQTRFKTFDYNKYVDDGENSANEHVRAAAAAERKMFEELLANQAKSYDMMMQQMRDDNAQQKEELV